MNLAAKSKDQRVIRARGSLKKKGKKGMAEPLNLGRPQGEPKQKIFAVPG